MAPVGPCLWKLVSRALRSAPDEKKSLFPVMRMACTDGEASAEEMSSRSLWRVSEERVLAGGLWMYTTLVLVMLVQSSG